MKRIKDTTYNMFNKMDFAKSLLVLGVFVLYTLVFVDISPAPPPPPPIPGGSGYQSPVSTELANAFAIGAIAVYGAYRFRRKK